MMITIIAIQDLGICKSAYHMLGTGAKPFHPSPRLPTAATAWVKRPQSTTNVTQQRDKLDVRDATRGRGTCVTGLTGTKMPYGNALHSQAKPQSRSFQG